MGRRRACSTSTQEVEIGLAEPDLHLAPPPAPQNGNHPPLTSVTALASAVAVVCRHLDLGCHGSDSEGEEEVEVEVRCYGRCGKTLRLRLPHRSPRRPLFPRQRVVPCCLRPLSALSTSEAGSPPPLHTPQPDDSGVISTA
eukprot:gene14416-biopygen6614